MIAVRERPNWCAVVAYCSGTGGCGWKRVSKASKVSRRVRGEVDFVRRAPVVRERDMVELEVRSWR